MVWFEFGHGKKLNDHSYTWRFLNRTSRNAVAFSNLIGHEYYEWLIGLIHVIRGPVIEYRMHCRLFYDNFYDVYEDCFQQYKLSIVDDAHQEMWSSKTVEEFFYMEPRSRTCMDGQRFLVPCSIMWEVDSRLKAGKDIFVKLEFTTKGEGEEADSVRSPKLGLEFEDTGSLLEDVKDLLLDKDDVDVTITVQGREFKAHKCILKARSPVFKRMFSNNMLENVKGGVDIEDCDPDVFGIFRKYLYSGKVDGLTQKTVTPLYHLADKYEVPSLCKICMCFIEKNFEVEEFGDFAEIACMNKEKEDFFAASVAFLAKNFKEIVDTVSWTSFQRRNLEGANEMTKECWQQHFFKHSGSQGQSHMGGGVQQSQSSMNFNAGAGNPQQGGGHF